MTGSAPATAARRSWSSSQTSTSAPSSTRRGGRRPTDRAEADHQDRFAGDAAPAGSGVGSGVPPGSGVEGRDVGVRRTRVVVGHRAASEVEGQEPAVVGGEDQIVVAGERLGEAADVGRLGHAHGAAAQMAADRRHAVGEARDQALAARDRHDGDGGVGEGVASDALAHAAGPRGERREVAAGERCERPLDLVEMRGQRADVAFDETCHGAPSPRSDAGPG